MRADYDSKANAISITLTPVAHAERADQVHARGNAFELVRRGVRLIVEPARAAREIRCMRGAGDVAMTTDEILALTRW